MQQTINEAHHCCMNIEETLPPLFTYRACGLEEESHMYNTCFHGIVLPHRHVQTKLVMPLRGGVGSIAVWSQRSSAEGKL